MLILICYWSGAGVGAGAGDRHGGCQRAGLGAPQPRPPQTLAHGDYSSRAAGVSILFGNLVSFPQICVILGSKLPFFVKFHMIYVGPF